MWNRRSDQNKSAITVLADRGGIAAGRDVNISGIPPERLPEIIAAATGPLERITGEQRETIADLERRFGATREQVLAFFRITGEAGVPTEAMGTGGMRTPFTVLPPLLKRRWRSALGSAFRCNGR